MFTANSMNCLAEALGLALPGNGTILATSADRKTLYEHAARRVVEMAREFARAGPRTRPVAPRDRLGRSVR